MIIYFDTLDVDDVCIVALLWYQVIRVIDCDQSGGPRVDRVPPVAPICPYLESRVVSYETAVLCERILRELKKNVFELNWNIKILNIEILN